MHPGQLYIPYKISIADILFSMKDELPYGYDIDMTCVMMEMLHLVFFERISRFGKYEGVLGAYLIQVPVTMNEKQQYDLDIMMHDYIGMLTDVLAQTFPSMVMRPLNHYFYYPTGETDLLIYVPVTEDLPPEISAKAVPEEAIRNSIR